MSYSNPFAIRRERDELTATSIGGARQARLTRTPRADDWIFTAKIGEGGENLTLRLFLRGNGPALHIAHLAIDSTAESPSIHFGLLPPVDLNAILVWAKAFRRSIRDNAPRSSDALQSDQPTEEY